MKYTERVEQGLEGLEAVSTGVCPGCKDCMNNFGFEDMEEFQMAWESQSGGVVDEPHFSWGPCGICGSTLGGDHEVWHWVDIDGVVVHEVGACVDCVCYLANGDIPQGED